MKKVSPSRASLRQRGFTMLELMVVFAIIAVLAAIGLPMFKERKLEGQAPETAKATQAAILKLKNNRDGVAGGTPYAGAANAELISILNSDARFSINGTNAEHLLGGQGGKMVYSAGNLGTAGDSGRLVLDKVNGAACIVYVNAIKNFAEKIQVNPGGSPVTVKDTTASMAYNAPLAQSTCANGDVNTITLEFR